MWGICDIREMSHLYGKLYHVTPIFRELYVNFVYSSCFGRF